jgi:hypothetical protein
MTLKPVTFIEDEMSLPKQKMKNHDGPASGPTPVVQEIRSNSRRRNSAAQKPLHPESIKGRQVIS